MREKMFARSYAEGGSLFLVLLLLMLVVVFFGPTPGKVVGLREEGNKRFKQTGGRVGAKNNNKIPTSKHHRKEKSLHCGVIWECCDRGDVATRLIVL